jgi:predicted TIM-barrel enzyme
MALLSKRLKQFTHLPVGISVLRNDPETALAIALNTGADFLRLSVLSGALISESGVVNSRSNQLLHYKNRLKAELPPLLVDLSPQHLTTGINQAVIGQAQALERLLTLAQELPSNFGPISLAISSQSLQPNELHQFRRQVSFPVWLEHQSAHTEPDAWFEFADGLILETGIRKTSALQPHLPPTIDMPQVEELVNRLRGIKPVQEMDPDIFLQR